MHGTQLGHVAQNIALLGDSLAAGSGRAGLEAGLCSQNAVRQKRKGGLRKEVRIRTGTLKLRN